MQTNFKHKDKLNIVDKISLISKKINLKNYPLKKKISIRLLKVLIKEIYIKGLWRKDNCDMYYL